VEKAIDRIKASGKVKINSWRAMSATGKYVVDAVVEAIRGVDVFACDLTYPNPNVLFELGYAVARMKIVWPTLNTTVSGAREKYEVLNATILPVIAYSPYENSQQLAEAFIKARPWLESSDSLLGPGFDPKLRRSEKPSLLYLKQPHDTEESIVLSETLDASNFAGSLIVDNPKETPSSTLSWYAENVRDTDATIVHLLSTDNTDNEFHNLKCAFVAGLAVGLGKPILMLAPEPYRTPVDYRALLKRHSTAEQCRFFAVPWLGETETHLPKRRRRPGPDLLETATELDLRALRVGDWVAENEHSSLEAYFVETRWYYDALSGAHNIFVGRRGSGKSATLYALRDDLGRNRLNHVCVVKPVGYEVHGLIRVLSQSVGRSEKGYLVESLWKFLIYTELAISVASRIYVEPSYGVGQLSAEEKKFIAFFEDYASIINQPFSIRLERAILPLLGLEHLATADEQRMRISEYLHDAMISRLRIALGDALSKRKRVALLLDNLDESWGPGEHVEHLSSLLLGLMRVSVDVAEDLRDSDARKKFINATVVVFIRSDIFFHVQQLAPEQDKLPLQRVAWGSHEEILRLIDERLVSSVDRRWTADTIWSKLFAPVASIPAREFIARWTVRRPRDVIFFVREAIATGVNAGHSIVSEEDMYQARRHYSEFAYRALLAEDDPRRGKLAAVLVKFARAKPELDYTSVLDRLTAAGVPDEDREFYVDLLCDLNFLGIGTRDGFRFSEHEGDRQLLRQVVHEAASYRKPGQEERYAVNRAFYDVLQIA